MVFTPTPFEIQDLAICELTLSLVWTNSYNISGWQCHQNKPLIPVCSNFTSLWSGVSCNANIITSIVLQNKELQGYISADIGYLTGLLSLDFTSNKLTGSIPTVIGFLSQLSKLSLSYNNIGGMIPDQLMYLSSLSILTMSANDFIGTIPSTIRNLSKLTTLGIHSNHLTGNALVSICSLKKLQNLFLHTNSFTDKIPSDISKLQFLQVFTIHNNSLNGPIPSTISQLPCCSLLSIAINDLTGTIPTEIGAMSSLVYVTMARNSLTGSLPTSLGKLKQLIILCIHRNLLTGTIPTEFSKWSMIRNLQFYSNRLIGTIPSTLGNLLQLQYIRLDSNYLTGSIPSSILNLKALKGFEVGHNHLTGTLPLFSKLPQIQIIRLNNNNFFGTISENVFNASKLTDVDISNNKLSGTLPILPFKASNLHVFAASVNCFEPVIPQEICHAVNLKILALDGMKVADSCRSKLFKDTSIKTYYLNIKKYQTIPTCLFSMSELKILHLSGNAFKGHLPSDAILSSHFQDLTLSNNFLSGTIPIIFQNKVWERFDLSYNKFNGMLSNYININQNTTIKLNVNRISGKVPSSLYDAADISILEGNMFECYLNTRKLPKHDPKSDRYICGSDSIIVSSLIFAVFFMLFGCLYFFRRTALRGRGSNPMLLKRFHSYVNNIIYIENNYNVYDYSDTNTTTNATTIKSNFDLLMRKFIKFMSILSIFILTICLPVYSVLGIYYSTHHKRYGWQLSVAFLSGKYATFPLIIVLLIFLLILAINIPVNNQKHAINQHDDTTWCQRMCSVFVLLCLIVVNFIVIIPVIGLYVYSTVAYNSTIMTFIQIAIGSFKTVWSELYVKNIAVLERVILPTTKRDDRKEMIYIAVILIINNVVIPLLAEAAIDANCYYHMIKSLPVVEVSYSYGDPCTFTILGYCVSPNVGVSTITYTPPFLYSYQCSSILITNFSSVFMYMFVFISIFAPFGYYFKPIKDSLRGGVHCKVHVPAYLGELLSYLAILITFGAVFPPLTIVIYIAITINIYFTQKCMSLTLSTSLTVPQPIDDLPLQLTVNDDDDDDVTMLNASDILLLVPFAGIFYSFFLIDILGDEVGLENCYWAPIVMTGISIIIFLIFYISRFTLLVKNHSNKTVVPFLLTID